MNLIGTSINIERKRLLQLICAAEKLGKSETELLSILLQKSRRLFGDTAIVKQTVKYQRDCNDSDYIIHHINFIDCDYEFATGKRYLFKISVSFLIRLAIDACLSEIIREWTLKPLETARAREKYLTNFHYKFFDIGHMYRNSSEYWVIPWPIE